MRAHYIYFKRFLSQNYLSVQIFVFMTSKFSLEI